MNEEQIYQDFFDDLVEAIEGMDGVDVQKLPSIPEFIGDNVWDATITSSLNTLYLSPNRRLG